MTTLLHIYAFVAALLFAITAWSGREYCDDCDFDGFIFWFLIAMAILGFSLAFGPVSLTIHIGA